jgi:hypothetical protein
VGLEAVEADEEDGGAEGDDEGVEHKAPALARLRVLWGGSIGIESSHVWCLMCRKHWHAHVYMGVSCPLDPTFPPPPLNLSHLDLPGVAPREERVERQRQKGQHAGQAAGEVRGHGRGGGSADGCVGGV